jgi:hypothetical protein
VRSRTSSRYSSASTSYTPRHCFHLKQYFHSIVDIRSQLTLKLGRKKRPQLRSCTSSCFFRRQSGGTCKSWQFVARCTYRSRGQSVRPGCRQGTRPLGGKCQRDERARQMHARIVRRRAGRKPLREIQGDPGCGGGRQGLRLPGARMLLGTAPQRIRRGQVSGAIFAGSD